MTDLTIQERLRVHAKIDGSSLCLSGPDLDAVAAAMDIGEFRESLASSELEPKTLGVCLALTDILSKIRPGDGQHLGLSYFLERLEKGSRAEEILPALSVLCTFEGAILEMHGYLDGDDEGQLHLEDEDFQGLLFTGKLVHPVTGDLVDDPLEHVRFFYSLRSDA